VHAIVKACDREEKQHIQHLAPRIRGNDVLQSARFSRESRDGEGGGGERAAATYHNPSQRNVNVNDGSGWTVNVAADAAKH